MKKNGGNAINFEDTLFIIHTRVQMLHEVLTLDISSDLFLDKTIDDMSFIGKTLDILIKALTEDTYILERDEQLDNVSETEWQFSQVLTRFLTVSGNISANRFPAFREKILALRIQSAARRKIADDSRTKPVRAGMEPLVSSDEMSELLKDL
jgi:hypothetical protein